MIGNLPLAEITPAVISECREKLLEETMHLSKKRSPASVNRYIALLSSVFSTAVREWQWMQDNPAKKIIKFKEPEGRTRFLSKNEIARLIQECKNSNNKDILLAVVLFLSTGARNMEICLLFQPLRLQI